MQGHDSGLIKNFYSVIRRSLRQVEREARTKFPGNDSEWRKMVGPTHCMDDELEKNSTESEEDMSDEMQGQPEVPQSGKWNEDFVDRNSIRSPVSSLSFRLGLTFKPSLLSLLSVSA